MTVDARRADIISAIQAETGIDDLIGLGLGPTYLGAASDFFRAQFPDNSLQMAFYTLIPFYGLAIVMFIGLARKIRRLHPAKGAS